VCLLEFKHSLFCFTELRFRGKVTYLVFRFVVLTVLDVFQLRFMPLCIQSVHQVSAPLNWGSRGRRLLEGECFIVHRENIQLLGINVCLRLPSQHKRRDNEVNRVKEVFFKLRLSQTSNRDFILASHTYAKACNVIVYKLLSQVLNFRTGSVSKICKERRSYLHMERGGGDIYCRCSYRWVRLRLRTAVANGSSLR
jgi:hypothetical protein